MPKDKSHLGLAIVGFAVAAGCTNRAPRVYVDLGAVPNQIPGTNRLTALGSAIGAQVGAEAISMAPVTVSLESAPATPSIPQPNSAPKQSRSQIRKLVRLVADAPLRALEIEEENAIEAARRRYFGQREQMLATLMPDFQRIADRRFWPMVRLTNLVGFPDPGGETRFGNDPIPLYPPNEPEKYRLAIADADAEWRSAFLRAQGQWELKFEGELAQIRLERAIKEDEALKDAERIVNLIFEPAEVKMPQPLQAEILPKVEGKAVTAKVTPLRSEMVQPPLRPLSQIREGLSKGEEAKLWASTHGYELSSSKAGARDATEEFLRWRVQNGIGR
ncbi:MAG: hypothetical protein JST40_01390 [Armatimonadetes bacterium]|nr:hypothetical protein [Armatimonadota bacterium]